MAVAITINRGTLEIGVQQKLFDGVITARGTTYDTVDVKRFSSSTTASRPHGRLR